MPLDMQPSWALRGLPCAPVGSAGVPAGGGRPAGATCGMHAFGALGPEGGPLGHVSRLPWAPCACCCGCSTACDPATLSLR